MCIQDSLKASYWQFTFMHLLCINQWFKATGILLICSGTYLSSMDVSSTFLPNRSSSFWGFFTLDLGAELADEYQHPVSRKVNDWKSMSVPLFIVLEGEQKTSPRLLKAMHAGGASKSSTECRLSSSYKSNAQFICATKLRWNKSINFPSQHMTLSTRGLNNTRKFSLIFLQML